MSDYSAFKKLLEEKVGIEVKTDEPMGKHTSLKVGGPADLFVIPDTQEKLEQIFQLAIKENIPCFVLGGGTNILVGDKGIRGLTVKNKITDIKYGEKTKTVNFKYTGTMRKQQTLWRKGLLKFDDFNYDDSSNESVFVDVMAGTQLSLFVTQTLNKDLVGMQWFARIPGTIGGAIWNNIHGADRFIGDYLWEVKVIDKNGNEKTYSRDKLQFDYNESFFQDTNSLITSAKLQLFLGDVKKAKKTFEVWKKRKELQPLNSAGSTFSNLSDQEKKEANLENLSAGYVVDKILDMNGFKVGNARIFENHGNFIVTDPGATAKNVLEIIQIVQNRAKEKVGVDLKTEIVKVGEF